MAVDAPLLRREGCSGKDRDAPRRKIRQRRQSRSFVLLRLDELLREAWRALKPARSADIQHLHAFNRDE